ncbi:hypothetical protein [Chordicoccus furentiruminis]|uniref:hypothetical protein n=1 Tax=Chordicoccus furentiruminis TaxID=2709410 RepID=UPI0023A7E5A9|nr:hypothetical protein [Chordicoccus furentiruminis]
MADIKFSEATLMEQSAQLAGLQQQYEDIFTQVASVLNSMNENWSESLAGNFSGKISGAQKAFSSVVNMLANGSSAAKVASLSYSDVGSVLGSLISSVTEGGGETASGESMMGTLLTSVIEGSDMNTTSAALVKQLLDDPEIMAGTGLDQLDPETQELVKSTLQGVVGSATAGDYKAVLQTLKDAGNQELANQVDKVLQSDWARANNIASAEDLGMAKALKEATGGAVDLNQQATDLVKGAISGTAKGVRDVAESGGDPEKICEAAVGATWNATGGNVLNASEGQAFDFIMNDKYDNAAVNQGVFGQLRQNAKETYQELGVSNWKEAVGADVDMVQSWFTGNNDHYNQNYYATHSTSQVIGDVVDDARYIAGQVYHSIFK